AFKPTAAVALGLIMHELATNATKYGALAKPDGQVAVTWSIDGSSRRTLALDWRESGGGPVARPKHKGFGTELIEREVKGTLGGKLDLAYARDGLQARITIPLDASNVAPMHPRRSGA